MSKQVINIYWVFKHPSYSDHFWIKSNNIFLLPYLKNDSLVNGVHGKQGCHENSQPKDGSLVYLQLLIVLLALGVI
jgi:hypothetical protein